MQRRLRRLGLAHRRLAKSVGRWLEAERRSAEEAAEEALGGVFRRLPAPAPGAGLVARVMAGVGLAPPAVVQPGLGWRIAISGGLAVAAVAAAVAPAVVPGLALDLLDRLSPAAMIGLVVGGLVETCQRFAEGLAFWQIMIAIGRTVNTALSAPPMLAVLATALLLSAGGFRMLHGLLVMERSR